MVLERGDIRVDLGAWRATVGGVDVRLTATEFKLLVLFLRNPERVLTRANIGAALWTYEPSANVIHQHVSSLRAKAGQIIETIVGIGYRLK